MSQLLQFLIENPVDNLTAEVTVSPGRKVSQIKGMTDQIFRSIRNCLLRSEEKVEFDSKTSMNW